MVYCDFILEGSTLKDLNTEIRYDLATARVDGKELVCFSSKNEDADAFGLALRVLRGLKREGSLQFFVLHKALSQQAQEAAYIMNKYSGYICASDERSCAVYVKI